MTWADELPIIAANIIIFASIGWSITASGRYFIKHANQFDKDFPALTKGQYHWLIWPAIGANFFFEHIFGKRGNTIWDLYTWRSVGVTFLISLLANTICILLILTSAPDDLPNFGLKITKILIFSYIIFIIFNFFGDLVSLGFTRHVLNIVVSGKCNFLRYLAIDVLGIVFGYLVTLVASYTLLFYCLMTDTELNEFIHSGFMGAIIIPFFLFIFIFSDVSFSITLFSLIAIFSITIPTVLYLTLMVFCFFGYQMRQLFWKNRDLGIIGNLLGLAASFFRFLATFLAPILFAISTLWLFHW